MPRTAPEEEDSATRLSTPCGAAVTIRLAQKMLADYCGKLPGCDRCEVVVCCQTCVCAREDLFRVAVCSIQLPIPMR